MTGVVVFIGDSITEAGRRVDDPADLGRGYVARVAALRSAQWRDTRIINSGIGGNRAVDLVARWERDCLQYEPDLVSIHVGINDTWRRYDGGAPTSTESFAADYRSVLEATARAGARIVMIEPFLLAVAPGQDDWRDDLDPKIEAVRALAREFGATLVEADAAFARAAGEVGAEALLFDGVHPTDAGSDVLARVWHETVAS